MYNIHIVLVNVKRFRSHTKNCGFYAIENKLFLLYSSQRSFLRRFTSDEKNSEKFFRVLHDRMKEAQSEIKANIVVNTGDPLGGTNAGLNEIADKDESAKKREPS